MDTSNHVTQEAGNRIRGAKLRESFVASPLTRTACEDLQRQFEEVARPEDAVVPDVCVFVDFMNRLAQRRFAEYLVADRAIRAAKSLYAHLAEKRDGAAMELAGVLGPAKQISDDLLPRLWLHGPVARTPSSLHRQAEDVSFWIHEAKDVLGEPVLQSLRIEPDELAAEIERTTEKLGGALGSLDDVASHLEASRFRAQRAGEACDQSYLQVKATLEVVCRLAGKATEVRKYGPPSLRKLQRSKKRKRRGVAAEQVLEAAVRIGDSPVADPTVSVQESDLQPEASSTGVKQSDLQTETRAVSVEQSDLQAGTCSTGVCRDESALPDGSRRKRRRDLAVTNGGGGHGARFSAVTGGVRGPCRERLSVTGRVCERRGSGSEVTDAVRSPENRGGAFREGVTARIRRFFGRPVNG